LLSTSTLTPTAAWTVPRTLIPWPAHVGAPVFLLFFNPLEARLPPRHRVWRWRVVGTGTLCWIDSTLALVLAEILKSDFWLYWILSRVIPIHALVFPYMDICRTSLLG
jgi:hypothetical protein